MRAPAAFVALALLAGCGPGRLVRHGQVNDDALALVRRTLPVVRELAFTAPVPVAVLDPAAISATLVREIDDSYAPGEFEHMQAVYARLGLLPAGTPLRPALQRLYEEEGAGFYDPRRKELVVASRALRAGGFWIGLLGGLTGRDFVGEFLVAHELTHALQDQHYGIPSDPEPLTDAHGDALLARHALLEGDATLTGFAYTRGGELDRATIGWIEAQLRGVAGELAARYPDVPEVVRQSLAFQYDAGTAFVGWALADGGWAAVDRVHTDPPASTEQVLHPARYFGVRDVPVPVTVVGTEGLEAAGWTRILDDTIGELQIRVLAARVLGRERGAQVADGWGGDRVRALERGGDLVLVWMTAWDSPAEAAEFADALPKLLPAARSERRGERVLLLLGPASGVDLDALEARAWGVSREFPGRETRRDGSARRAPRSPRPPPRASAGGPAR